MLSRARVGAIGAIFMIAAGCGGGDPAPNTSGGEASATSGPSSTDYSGEFVNGVGPEQRAWLERQRGASVGSGQSGQVDVAPLTYGPASAELILDRFGGASGAEVALAHPQSHRIQFLKGGAARVYIWDGARHRPSVFTSVESRQGARICLARTRGWTGGCLTMLTNGQDFLCQYLWNNGATGKIGCRVTPIRAS